jgi:hypothetical protein
MGSSISSSDNSSSSSSCGSIILVVVAATLRPLQPRGHEFNCQYLHGELF